MGGLATQSDGTLRFAVLFCLWRQPGLKSRAGCFCFVPMIATTMENARASAEPAGAVRKIMLLVLGCVLLLEIALGRSEFAWRLVPRSAVGVLLETEEKVIAPNPNPKVLVMGTSRANGAFLPTVMEQHLGLRRGEVLNLAMGEQIPFDMLSMYERNRARLSRASLVFLQVDDFQFAVREKAFGRFRKMASWSERMSFSGRTRMQLMSDYVLQANTALPLLWFYAQSWVVNGSAPQSPGMDQYGRLALEAIADDHNERLFTERGFRTWISWFYPDYKHSPIFEKHFLKLVELIKEDGGEVVIVIMPTVSDFPTYVREAIGDDYDRFRARMLQVSSEMNVGCLLWDDHREAGLTFRDFRDWGHLNTPGAEKWSRFISDWVLAERQGNRLKWKLQDPVDRTRSRGPQSIP